MTLILYNLLITLFLLLYSPIHVIRLIMGSKYRESTLPRLGFQNYPKAEKARKTFLIHSVSVGETQVAGTLSAELKKMLSKQKKGKAFPRKKEGHTFRAH